MIGEESADGDGDGDGEPASAFCWVVDPIDGTRAFITGRPTFGTLIALLHEGRPLIGLIDQPVTGERWLGVRGRPTRFTGPFGGTVGTRACTELAAAELSATSPAMFDTDTKPRFDRLAGAVARTSWGGDCYSYGLLALGQLDLVAEAAMKPWDWAALVPVVEGAGGVVTDWEGRPLNLAAPSPGAGGRERRPDVQVLACAHAALADAARVCLARPVPPPAWPAIAGSRSTP